MDAIVDEYVEFDKMIDPYVTDTSAYLNEALAEGKTILAEAPRARCSTWTTARTPT